MKRKGDDNGEGHAPKKIHQDDDLQYFQESTNEVGWDDIERTMLRERDESKSRTGWILATVQMTWNMPPQRDEKFMLVSGDGKQLALTFSRASGVTLKTLDQIKLSLEGAALERDQRKSSNFSRLPFTLSFGCGLAVMFVRKNEDGCNIVNTLPSTWPLFSVLFTNSAHSVGYTEKNDWFGTPSQSDVEMDVVEFQVGNRSHLVQSELAQSPTGTPAPTPHPRDNDVAGRQIHAPESVFDEVFLVNEKNSSGRQSPVDEGARTNGNVEQAKPEDLREEICDKVPVRQEQKKKKKKKKARYVADKSAKDAKSDPANDISETVQNPVLEMKAGLVSPQWKSDHRLSTNNFVERLSMSQ